MRNFKFKIDFTWRDIMIRVALVICTTAVIVWFMPRDNKPNFKLEMGKPWKYNDLTATFDFPVQKSDSVLEAERNFALRDYEPYYDLNRQIAPKQELLLEEQIDTVLTAADQPLRRAIIIQLHKIYNQGIIDTKEPLGGETDTLHTNSQSTQPYVSVNVTISANMEISIKNSDETFYTFTTPSDLTNVSLGGGGGGRPGGMGQGGSTVLISVPGLVSGSTYNVDYGSSSTSTTAKQYGSSGFGPGGGR